MKKILLFLCVVLLFSGCLPVYYPGYGGRHYRSFYTPRYSRPIQFHGYRRH